MTVHAPDRPGDVRRQARELRTNSVLAELYAKAARSMGARFFPREFERGISCGSTDMGNVSQVVPSIHPMFRIPAKRGEGNHTRGFTAAAKSPEALAAARRAGKALAHAALDCLLEPRLVAAAKAEFAEGARASIPRRA